MGLRISALLGDGGQRTAPNGKPPSGSAPPGIYVSHRGLWKQRTAEYRTIEPQKSEVKTRLSGSVLLISPFDCSTFCTANHQLLRAVRKLPGPAFYHGEFYASGYRQFKEANAIAEKSNKTGNGQTSQPFLGGAWAAEASIAAHDPGDPRKGWLVTAGLEMSNPRPRRRRLFVPLRVCPFPVLRGATEARGWVAGEASAAVCCFFHRAD